MIENGFYILVKRKLAEHEFKPVYLSQSKLREKTPQRKEQRKRYRQSEKGKESERKRSKRYYWIHREARLKHSADWDKEHQEQRLERWRRWRRNQRIKALWSLLTYDGLRTIFSNV